MKQLQAIKEMAEMLSGDDMRRVFITEWLEDINFHSECAELRKNFIQPQRDNKLARLTIARNKDSYTASHYKFLIDEKIVSEEDENDIQTLRNDGIIYKDYYTIRQETLNDYKFALDCAKSLSLVYGWGVENEIADNNLVATLEEIINSKPTAVRAIN